MRIVKVMALVAMSMVASASLASAQNIGGGTPDAQGGAVGRDQSSSLDGRGVRSAAGLTPRRGMSRTMMMKRHYRRHYRRRHDM